MNHNKYKHIFNKPVLNKTRLSNQKERKSVIPLQSQLPKNMFEKPGTGKTESCRISIAVQKTSNRLSDQEINKATLNNSAVIA